MRKDMHSKFIPSPKEIISDFFVINMVIMPILFFAKIIGISLIFLLIILLLSNIEIAYLEVKYILYHKLF